MKKKIGIVIISFLIIIVALVAPAYFSKYFKKQETEQIKWDLIK